MHRILRLVAGFLLALGLVANASAATADGKSPATAFPLPSSLTATGSILGSPGGAFIFYTFNNPGTASTGTISLTINPPDPVTSSTFGLNVYEAGATLVSLNAVNTGARSAPTLPHSRRRRPVQCWCRPIITAMGSRPRSPLLSPG